MQTQQQRPESPTVTLTWHASKYRVHKLHHRYNPLLSTSAVSLILFQINCVEFAYTAVLACSNVILEK